MHGVPEAVHARGDDGRSAEDVWAQVPTRTTAEASAGASTTRPRGPPRRRVRAPGDAPRGRAAGAGRVRMSRAGFAGDPLGVTKKSRPNRGRGRAPVTRRLRPRGARNLARIRPRAGGGGRVSRAGFGAQATMTTRESRRIWARVTGLHGGPAGLGARMAAVTASPTAPRTTSLAELGERLAALRLCEAPALDA